MDTEEAQDMLGLGLSAGFKFEPDDDELVEYFLLRKILGEQLPLEGVILEDDPLRVAPWKLLRDHKRGDDAFFFANGQAIHNKGSRQKRTCVDGCWEGQKVLVEGERMLVHDSGKEIVWRKYMLNFHDKRKDGSKGWVMHEYLITAPADLASSSLRLYRIRFSGHGKNRKREPDDYCREEGGARAAKRQARADAEPGLLEEHISDARPAETSYSNQDYQYQWPQVFVPADSSFPPSADVGDYAGPAAAASHQGWNTMNLPTHGDGVPGVMNEYDRVAAAAIAGMPPFHQGSFSGAIDEPPFMNFELPDQNFNIDESLVFPDPCGLEAPVLDEYSSASMQTQSSVPAQYIWPQGR